MFLTYMRVDARPWWLQRTRPSAWQGVSFTNSRTVSNDSYVFPLTAGSTAYASNGKNQMVQAGSAVPTWDKKGNLTSDGTNSYTYSSENLLTHVVQWLAFTLDSFAEKHLKPPVPRRPDETKQQCKARVAGNTARKVGAGAAGVALGWAVGALPPNAFCRRRGWYIDNLDVDTRPFRSESSDVVPNSRH
jgi:hypothetical protein